MAYDMDTVEIPLEALPSELQTAIRAAVDDGARTAIVIDGERVAGIVPTDEVEMLEQHEDEYFARCAEESRAAQGDQPAKPLMQVLAEIDAEEYGKATA